MLYFSFLGQGTKDKSPGRCFLKLTVFNMLQVSEPRNGKHITGIAYFELLEILRIFSPRPVLFSTYRFSSDPVFLAFPHGIGGGEPLTRGIRNVGLLILVVLEPLIELAQLQIQIKVK